MTHLNEERPIRRLGVTRRQLLEQIDRPALKSLPSEPYEFSEWRIRRVGIDYHIEVAAHYYSVPHRFARAEVDARLTARTVENFLKGERIAAHMRLSGTRHRHRRAHLRFGQIHPRQPPRSAARAKACHGRNADPAFQHPWSALLQLGETNLLKHPTLDQLQALGLHGMAKAFAEIAAGGEADGLGHQEWLGLLLDRETSWRQDKRLVARLRVAKLRQQACVEDVDYRNPRGLDRALFQKLAEGEWINAHDNLALIGPTGVGKSWLASALGHKACRDNRSVLYQRVPRLFEALALARGDGRHPRLLRNLGRADLLILDDWGLEPLDAAARHDLLEILEERYGRRSTMITSQLPLDKWHEIIGDPTYADAILDRLVHNAHRIELAGESMRRTRGKQHQKA